MQFGDNNDGMSLFAFPDDPNRALMAINNEYTNYRYLYPHGGQPTSAEDAHKAQASEGVSVIEIQRKGDRWQFVQGSPFNRRIHGNTPIRLSGPAAGHALLRTQADSLRLQARDAQAAGDRLYWPIYNLDLKNPNAPEEETHDPDVLLDKYKTLLGQIEETENRLKSELAAALAHHFTTEEAEQ